MGTFTVDSSKLANDSRDQSLLTRSWYLNQLANIARGRQLIGSREWSALCALAKARGWNKARKRPGRKAGKAYPAKKQAELSEELAARLGES